jgi:hypothetical protein
VSARDNRGGVSPLGGARSRWQRDRDLKNLAPCSEAAQCEGQALCTWMCAGAVRHARPASDASEQSSSRAELEPRRQGHEGGLSHGFITHPAKMLLRSSKIKSPAEISSSTARQISSSASRMSSLRPYRSRAR